jgi:hypothetical protein
MSTYAWSIALCVKRLHVVDVDVDVDGNGDVDLDLRPSS